LDYQYVTTVLVGNRSIGSRTIMPAFPNVAEL
jgi:hypothetical protein